MIQMSHVHIACDPIKLAVQGRLPQLEGVEVEGEADDAAVGVAQAEVVVLVEDRHWARLVRYLGGCDQAVEAASLLVDNYAFLLLCHCQWLRPLLDLLIVPLEDAIHHFLHRW